MHVVQTLNLDYFLLCTCYTYIYIFTGPLNILILANDPYRKKRNLLPSVLISI